MTVKELYSKIGNYDDAISRLMNDKLISKFVMKFLTDPSYDLLIKAWEEQDEKGIFTASHTMKGVCANLSLTDLFSIASSITEAYRPGNEALKADFPAEQAFENLKKEYARVTACIVEYSEQKEI